MGFEFGSILEVDATITAIAFTVTVIALGIADYIFMKIEIFMEMYVIERFATLLLLCY
jgi:hypothetical protein